MLNYTHLITHIGWSKTQSAGFSQPEVQLRSLENNELSTIPVGKAGYSFNWHLSADRCCPGWYDLLSQTYHACPLQAKLQPGYERCRHCEDRVGFKAAFLFGQAANAQMQQYLAQPHYIYLAYFPPGIIKVGTAALSRKDVRLLEQDALLGVLVAQASGFDISKLEHAISGQLNFPEAVKASHKFAFLAEQPEQKKANSFLHAAAQRIMAHFNNSEYKSWLLSEADWEWQNHLHNPYIYFPAPELLVQRATAEDVLAGDYLGLRGKFLLLGSDHSVIGLSTKSLVGRKLLASAEQLQMNNGAAQLSLFS